MASTRFDFVNAAGRTLSGRLETGAEVRAYAIFAHCFTCDKTSLAATRVARALASHGIGVLRFDFTGLGASEGDFGGGLSSDVADLVAAASAMAAAGYPPRLLIGHSFGGAAVLAAAGGIAGVAAVATIAAPFAVDHVLAQLRPPDRAALAGGDDPNNGEGFGEADPASADGASPDEASGEPRIPVTIGGRPFTLGRGFVADLHGANQAERIASLHRALLVLHSPVDAIVGIDNASKIFAAAKHPKSFVALDGADHLLRDRADADYAAAVIAAWASRYVDTVGEVPVDAASATAGSAAASRASRSPADAKPIAGVRVEETGNGKFEVRVTTASGSFLADEPAGVGGNGAGPTPYDLLSAALGACTAMTCRLYATRKEWPLDRVTVEVGHTGRTAATRDRFVRRIGFAGALDAGQTAKLMDIADRCPVHRTLTAGATVETVQLADPAGHDAISALPDSPGDHAARMAESCAEEDRG